jgi:hypothetical protein
MRLPRLEALEERLAPAFDLLIGATDSTFNVINDGLGHFTVTGSHATLMVSDILTALTNGHSVTITDPDAGGFDDGNITWQAGTSGDLDYKSIGTGFFFVGLSGA